MFRPCIDLRERKGRQIVVGTSSGRSYEVGEAKLSKSLARLVWFVSVLCITSCILASRLRAGDAPLFPLRSNDVVAFIGGADVAAAQHTGHLEAVLAAKFPGVRFRNFGWEGDTVFAQPRDVGFPPLAEHLRRARVTVLFIEYGRAEALNGKNSVAEFVSAYEKLVGQFAKQFDGKSGGAERIALVTSPPFEPGGGLLPDLSRRNEELAAHVNGIRSLAQRRQLPLIDLYAELGMRNEKDFAHRASHSTSAPTNRLTENGFQLTARGHALVAAAFARQLGLGELAARAGDADSNGAWSNAQFEKLRRKVIEKNSLWFNYWRPQNWAFLGGDRTSQPSSRDHRDPKVRWFPAEMEKYLPLIAEKEAEMEDVAATIRGGVK